MTMFLFLLFTVYDSLFYLPFAWLKAAIGLGTGFFIRGKIVGLLACLLGDGLIYVFARLVSAAIKSGADSSAPAAAVPDSFAERIAGDLMVLLVMSILIFSGVLWWVAGRVLRRAFDRIHARLMPAKSVP